MYQAKDHVTRDNLSLQLAMQFLPRQILHVAVKMSDVRNLFCDLQWDYILRPPSISKYQRHSASIFSATWKAIFRSETSCKHAMSHEEVFLATCNATSLRCKLQGKLHRVTWPHAEKLKKLKIEFCKLNIHAEYNLRSGAGGPLGWVGWGGWGACSNLLVTYFSFRPLIKTSHFQMYKIYCQQIFPFVQLPYRFLLLALQSYFEAQFPSSMQSTFSKHSSKPSLLSAFLNPYDENVTF